MTRTSSQWRHALLALALVITCGATADLGPLAREAQSLIVSGKPEDALRLLQPAVQQYAGNSRFDYLYALALMDSGDNERAELVFERLLLQSPGFHGARLDYARVLVARKQYGPALVQLDTLEGYRPPEKAQAEITKLRTIIKHRSETSSWSRYLEASTAAGYDSNVNSATAVDEFLGFALDATSQEQDSEFFEVGVAGGIGYRISRGMQLSGRLTYRTRQNDEASFVDSDALSLDARFIRVTDTEYQQLKLVGYQFDIDGSRNSDGLALSGTWLRKIAPLWRIGIEGEAARIDYSNNLDVKDVDRFRVGLVGMYSLGANGQGQLVMRGGAATEKPRLTESRYERDFLYVGAALTWQFSEAFRAALSADYQNSRFDEVFFEQLYTESREDDRYRIRGSVDWTFRPAWTLSHSLSYTRNDTFVDIFEYERFEALLRLRYKFQ